MKFPSLENVGPTETFRRELRSLDRESDPELYFKGLLTAAYRLNQRGEIQAARQLFQIIQTESRENFPEASKRAEREIDALEGRGAFGQRVEFLGRSLFREAASPSALAGMAGAQAVFGLARAAFLFRLGALPTANFLTRGLGARVVASTGAFALEAPSFVAFHRGAKAALGEQQEWNPRILGEEFAASFLTLGALKLGAWAGGARKGLGQASTLGGILLGNRLEERAGLRGSSDGLNALTDGLATLLHLKVAGRLLGAAMGPRWADFQRELHWRGEGRGGPGRGPALAWRSLAPATGAGTFENPNILMMRGPKDRGSILEGELLEKAPHSVHRRIEKIKGGEEMANRTLLWYLVEDMIGQGRAALSVGEKKFLLDLSHRQLDQYQDPQSSYYQAFLVFRMLQDFAGLRRLANLLEDDNVHKRQALLMLEDYEQAFGSFDRQLRQNPERLLALDFAFHGMYPALFQRIDDFATSRGFPKPSVFAADRTAANLQQLASSYDLAIAIAKGGLSSGGVAEFLNIPVKVIDVHAHGREKPLSSFVDAIRPEDVAGKRILFMDKDMVTGASIREALRLIEAYKPGAVGAYFNHPLSDLVDPKAARELRDRGIALHFPNEIEAPSTLALFYHAHEKLDTPLGRFRKAGRKLEELAGKKKVRDYLNRQQRAFFAFNPDLPGVEGLRGMIANRLETLAESYSQVRIVSRSQAQTFLDRVLQHDTTLPPTYAAELANARYHPRAVEAAERRGVQNFHQPHSYLAAFRSAQQAAKEKYEVALIVGPEGFAYEPIFRDLGLKTVAVNIPEADFNGERSIATFENLSALRRRKVLVVEDDVQSGATLRRLLAEISPFQPGFLGLYLGLPPSRQKVENIPPAFKRIHLTEEQHPSDDAAFLKHLKKREPVFKSHSHR